MRWHGMGWVGLGWAGLPARMWIEEQGKKRAPGAGGDWWRGGWRAASLPPVENRLELIIGMIIGRETTSSTAARFGARRTLTWTEKSSLYPI